MIGIHCTNPNVVLHPPQASQSNAAKNTNKNVHFALLKSNLGTRSFEAAVTKKKSRSKKLPNSVHEDPAV
jgi:hypothetical protein